MKRLLVILLSAVLVAGCATPAQQSESRVEVGGTPWRAWMVRGALQADDEVRLEDDFFTAVNRDDILRRNANPNGPNSVVDDRRNEIDDQMLEVLRGDAKGSKQTAHDLQCLRDLYSLYEDWDARDADATKPVKPIFDRLDAIETLDQFSEWVGSDDFRLLLTWRGDKLYANDAQNSVSLFALSLVNPANDTAWMDDEGKPIPAEHRQGISLDGYAVELDSPLLPLASFDWDDEDFMVDGKLDTEWFQELRTASNNVDIAYQMLEYVGYTQEDASDIVCNAAELEAMLFDGMKTGNEYYKEYTREEFERECEGGFPLLKICDSFGYNDASFYTVGNTTWQSRLNELYTKENLDLFVSHAMTSVALRSASLLDSEAANIAYYADGDAYISDELLEAAEKSGVNTNDDASDSSEGPEMTQEELEQQNARYGCEYLRSVVPTSFAKVYVENFYDEQLTADVNDMVKSYLDAYEKLFGQEDWISNETRAGAIDKLHNMHIYVGHPEAWSNTDKLEVRAHDEEGTLFSETCRLAAYDLDQELGLMRSGKDGTYWRDCMEVNAYYTPTTNSIIIGAGILGGVYWPEDGSYEENLAGVGTTIGHEIGHAFDSSGSYFDKDGRYDIWWTKEDLADFEERVQGVKDAFNKIDPLGTGAYDGSQVCAEAIADMGGIKTSMLVASTRKDFDYDAFFRAYAKSWADVPRETDVREQLLVDTHPLDNHRVNVPVREVDEFYNTYNITKDDAMWLDAKDRISVW